jgi:hypothetical protein
MPVHTRRHRRGPVRNPCSYTALLYLMANLFVTGGNQLLIDVRVE